MVTNFYSKTHSGRANIELRMNTIQHATKILKPHIVPFIYSLQESPEDYQIVEARLQVHIAKLCQEYQKEYGITHMDWLVDWAGVDKSIGSMNNRVQQILKKDGVHTKF
jgi:hypothetical protein